MYSIQFARIWSKLSKDIKLHMESQLAPSLTEGQLHLLEYLLNEERMKPSDLVQYLATTPAAVTTLLDRMEKNELIVRERDANDRRIVWVYVTAKGKSEAKRGINIREQFLNDYLNRLSSRNQQLLVYLLGKVSNM